MYERVAPLLVGILLLIASAAAAQETTGSLQGQVVDPQKLAVPGATVTVTGPQGARTFVTDGEGRWVAPFLTPGRYTVRVDRKSTRLNSSHSQISYAVFCLKKKK